MTNRRSAVRSSAAVRSVVFIVMCGIAAFFSSDKRISAQRLKYATNCLRHCGPDSQGAWLCPNQRAVSVMRG
jgi:glutamine phosphoribosylpyrophosphate amidotransferase